MSTDQIGLIAGFVLTLMVFSYILRDNFLYRIAIFVFVGLSAGYIGILTVESVLLPWLRATVNSGDTSKAVAGVIPLLLGALLLVKTSSRLGRLGNLAMAFIIGVGAAVALLGAITGTLLPLADATVRAVRGNVLEGLILFVGVSSSLLYFQYTARRTPEGETERGRLSTVLGGIGQGFIVVTLGAVYAGAILTSLTIFSERIAFILRGINGG